MTVFQQTSRFGGSGGAPFTYHRVNSGGLVDKIEVWSGPWQLRGVRLHFTDGSSETIGQTEDHYVGEFKIDYENNERVIHLSIWTSSNVSSHFSNNTSPSRVGGLYIETNKGRKYWAHCFRTYFVAEHKVQVGSGIILGAQGSGGADVDTLGMFMLRKISAVDMVDIVYEMTRLPLPRKISAFEIIRENASNIPSTEDYHRIKKTFKTGGEWTRTDSYKIGQEFTVSGSIPILGGVGVSLTSSWELSTSTTSTRKWEKTSEYEQNIALIIPAKRRVRFNIDHFEGTINKLPFTARMMFLLDNGSKFFANVRGLYDGVSTTKFVEKMEELAIYNDKEFRWDPIPTSSRSLPIESVVVERDTPVLH